MGLQFLKAVNRGDNPKVGKRNRYWLRYFTLWIQLVVLMIWGQTVTCIDVQPAAFDEEIEYIESRGGKLVGTFMTAKSLTKVSMMIKVVSFQVIWLWYQSVKHLFLIIYHKMIALKNSVIGLYQIKNNSFRWNYLAGDVIKPGRLTDAIGSGQKAAYYADAYVMNKEVEAFPEKTASK